jgi:formylmethanofuran dehydrogenase subunit E
MQRFQLPFEPVEFAECDGCMGTIYADDTREIQNGQLLCLDCLTAHESSYEFEVS